MFLKSVWGKAALVGACLGAVGACSDPLPDIADEELVILIGEMSHLRERPYIPKRVVECIRLLSDLDREIYKDLAEPMLGAFRTSCRLALNKKIEDAKRNPKGAKLGHFEDPAVGERVTRLYAKLEEEDERRRREDQIRRDERKKAQAEEQLAVLRREVEALSDQADRKFEAAERDCEEWIALQEKIVAENRHSIWRSRPQPELCALSKRAEIREGIAKARALLKDLRVDGDILLFRMPALGSGDPKRIASLFAALARDLDEIRKDASE